MQFTVNSSAFGLPFATLPAFVARGSWDKGVEGLPKARQGVQRSRRAGPMSASPPATAPVQFVKREKKDLKGKETVSLSSNLCKLFFYPKFAHMIGELLRSEAITQKHKKIRTAIPPGEFLRVNKV